MQAHTATTTQTARREEPRRAEPRVARDGVAAAPGATPTPAHRPGIDGLRGIAVAAVVLAHTGRGWLPVGMVGVEILFVVTGFLLTSVLLAEYRARGRVFLPHLWARRSRRVLPALLTMIGGVSLYVLLLRPDELYRLGTEVRAALTGWSNWNLVAAPLSGPEALSPLRHLWSVAIGAQFMLVWPPVVVGLLRRIGRNRLRAMAWLLAVASAVALAVVAADAGLPRALHGTDTRLSGLPVGSGLALAFPPGAWAVRTRGARARRLRFVGLLMLAGIAGLAVLAAVQPVTVVRGVLFGVAVLSAVLIAAVLRSPECDHLLGATPLRWLGVRSYALYLCHWPVLLALGGPGGLTPPAWFLLYVVLTLVCADVAHRFVELPLAHVRSAGGDARAGRQGLAVRATAVACGAATVAALLTGGAGPPG